MKVLLVSLNAKYIHTNLAIRYLEGFCRDIEDIEIIIREFTINDHLDKILREIYQEQGDIVCFSCYIWNIEETLKIVKLLKRVHRNHKIILGGPEVSFYGKDWMKKVTEIDYIVKGEGEVTFKELLIAINDGLKNKSNIQGIIYREEDEIIENPDRALMEDLQVIPFPYIEDWSNFQNKIIYYESSRGCPFNCQYCLSSTTKGVRFFPLERVKNELRLFINAGVKQIKFVDRTFNCHPKRSMELLEFLIEAGGNTNFHFEVAADLISDDMIELLKTVPIGLFQLEIGIQSTKEQTLKAIKRVNDFSKIQRVVQSIKSFKNIHQHLDLIAGLPYESYEDFKTSFNDVYQLKPDMLQLGFLKLLKGSGIEIHKEYFGYKYRPFPPYEVLANKYITFDEMIKLKYVEELLEKYGNSHVFDYTIDYLISHFYRAPFDFFEDFASYWVHKSLFNPFHSQKYLYKILLDFIKSKGIKDRNELYEILKFDYLLTHRPPLPDFFHENIIPNKKEKVFDFLKQHENIHGYLPKYTGKSPKEIFKQVHFEKFNVNILEKLQLNTLSKTKKNITLLFDFGHSQEDIFHKNSFYEVEL